MIIYFRKKGYIRLKVDGNIYSIDDEFSVTAAPMFAEDKLKQIFEKYNIKYTVSL